MSLLSPFVKLILRFYFKNALLKKGIFFILLLSFILIDNCKAQFLDSIKSSFQSSPKPFIRLHTRNSFITNLFARVNGIQIGLDYNKTLKLGLGYNWLSSSIIKPINKVEAELKLHYISPFIEYTFYRNEKWDIAIPVLIGIGNAYYHYIKNSVPFKTNKTPVLFYEPYMTAQYRIIPWIGLGFGVGYRLSIIGNKQLKENFTAPIYVLKINLLVNELFKKSF